MHVELLGAKSVGSAAHWILFSLWIPNQLSAEHIAVEGVRAIPIGNVYHRVIERETWFRRHHTYVHLTRTSSVQTAEWQESTLMWRRNTDSPESTSSGSYG
jgi:hypothetical protein